MSCQLVIALYLFISSNEKVACQWFVSHAAAVVWENCISDGKRNPHLCAGVKRLFSDPVALSLVQNQSGL